MSWRLTVRCLVCWFSLRHWDEEELHVEVLEILCSSCHSEGFVAAGYVECIEWDWTVVRCSRRHWMTHFDSVSWEWSIPFRNCKTAVDKAANQLEMCFSHLMQQVFKGIWPIGIRDGSGGTLQRKSCQVKRLHRR